MIFSFYQSKLSNHFKSTLFVIICQHHKRKLFIHVETAIILQVIQCRFECVFFIFVQENYLQRVLK